MTDSDAFEAGYDAYWDGVECDENPYDEERELTEYNSWHRGWREARKDDYDENEG
jgi:ribosome modulation factor